MTIVDVITGDGTKVIKHALEVIYLAYLWPQVNGIGQTNIPAIRTFYIGV
jgi:hypothetical protein